MWKYCQMCFWTLWHFHLPQLSPWWGVGLSVPSRELCKGWTNKEGVSSSSSLSSASSQTGLASPFPKSIWFCKDMTNVLIKTKLFLHIFCILYGYALKTLPILFLVCRIACSIPAKLSVHVIKVSFAILVVQNLTESLMPPLSLWVTMPLGTTHLIHRFP